MASEPKLTPRLIVANTVEAIAFYAQAFGAEEKERYTTPGGFTVHAAISIDGALLSLADYREGWYAEPRAEGAPVLMTLSCADPDATAKRAVSLGAELLIPVDDRFYGAREGRIRDPFGHLWILSKKTSDPSPDAIQAVVNGLDA